MPVTSDRTILVMGSIEPQVLAQLRALAPRYEIVLAAEAPLTPTADLAEVAELLRAQIVQMAPCRVQRTPSPTTVASTAIGIGARPAIFDIPPERSALLSFECDRPTMRFNEFLRAPLVQCGI